MKDIQKRYPPKLICPFSEEKGVEAMTIGKNAIAHTDKREKTLLVARTMGGRRVLYEL